MNILGDYTDTTKNNTESLNDASTEVDQEVNPEKTKHMLLFHHQSAGKNHDIKTGNRSSQSVALGNNCNKSKPDSAGN